MRVQQMRDAKVREMVGVLDIRIATAEGRRVSAERQRDRVEDGRRLAQARVRLLEEVIADVWRWMNDGSPHLDLLRPTLLRAGTEYSLLMELDALEEAMRGKERLRP